MSYHDSNISTGKSTKNSSSGVNWIAMLIGEPSHALSIQKSAQQIKRRIVYGKRIFLEKWWRAEAISNNIIHAHTVFILLSEKWK